MARCSDSELLSLVVSYQNNPSNPEATAALLSALEGLIRAIAHPRAVAFGGFSDAKQETIAAVLTVAQRYKLTNIDWVELRIMGRTSDLLLTRVKREKTRREREVPQETALTPQSWEPLTRETEPESAKMLLDRALRKGVIRPAERPLLLLWAGGLSYQELADYFNQATQGRTRKKALTVRAVHERVSMALSKLRKWVKQEKKPTRKL